MTFTPPRAPGVTGRNRLARAARLCAVLAAPLLALAAAPAAAQTVSITSTPANGSYYAAGEAITTRIAFSSPTGLQGAQGAPFANAEMKLDIGGTERRAGITSSFATGLTQVDFSYTVVAADRDTDGVSIPANAIDLKGGTWQSRSGLNFVVISLNNAALGAQSSHQVIGAPFASISSTNPATLHEGNLNGATVTVALAGVAFGSGVTASSFELVTTMTGVSISSVSSVSSGDTTATLTLSGTPDISADAALAVRVLAAAHTGSSDLTTGTVSVAPVAAAISSTTPAALTEGALNGATVAVALSGVTFVSGVTTASFELVTTMTGVSISAVSSVSSGDASATLTLASTADISATADLAVKVLAAAHTGSADLTTGTVSVAPVLAAGPGASASALSVPVEEGSTSSWSVVLNANPGAGCTGAGSLTIAVASGDTGAVTVSPTELTFTAANWSTPQTVTATGVSDNDLADETVAVSHTVTSACAPDYTTGLSIASVTVAVDDDDRSLVTVDSPRVAEGDSGSTTMTFTVTLSPPASAQVTVPYRSGAGSTATPGTDFDAIAVATLTFAPGETTKTVSATVRGDTMPEGDETVDLQLGVITPSWVVRESLLWPGTIVDDDTPTLTIDSPSVAEGNDGTTDLVFTVTLEPPNPSQQVTVSYAHPTMAGTATAGTTDDYTALADGDLAFAAGETSKTITVTVQGDTEVEPDETVRVVIGGPTPTSPATFIRNADGDIAASAIGVGTITNDDAPAAPPAPPTSTEKLVLSAAELEVATGAEGATYTLSLGAAPTGPVTVAISSDKPHVTVSPASLSFDAANWSAPQTVTVTAAADDDDYADTAQLAHAASGGGLDGETAVVAALVSEPGDARVRAPAAGDPVVYMVGGRRVAVRAEAGVPPGVEFVPPASLSSDLSVTLRPVAEDAPLEPGAFAFGAEANAQVAVDVSVTGAPSAGLELCLPASEALRDASGGRALTLLRHDGTGWVEVAGARPVAAPPRVCAAGITAFSPFAVGWRANEAPPPDASDARARLAAVNRSILPEVSRAMWDSAAGAVARRFGSGAPAGYDAGADANGAAWAADALSWLAGRLGASGGADRARGPELFHDPRPYGPPEDSPAPPGAGWRALLPGSAFALGLSGGAAGDGPDAALWGSGDRRSLSLDDGALSWEGEVVALHAGADARTAPDGSGGRVLGGVSASWSESDIDYVDANGAESVKGRHEARMVSVQPYVGWLAGDGSRAWAALSHGRGEVEIADAEAGPADSSATQTAAAVGARTRALSRGAAALDVKGEAQAARFALDGDGDLVAGVTSQTFRLRVAAEGRYVIAFANGGSLTPSLEAGLRWDGGDGATGAGVELGGGAAWAAPSAPLTLEARGRALLAHGGDAEEWGVGGALRVAPGADGLGLSLALSPSWGAADSGLARLWSADAARADAGGGSARPSGRLDAEAGYGVRALGGVATPLAGFALTGDRSREWRVGGRFALAEALDLALATSLRESRAGPPDRRIALDLRLRW